MSNDEFRVLTAIEMGMKNHELVPVELINAISGLKHGGAYKFIRELLKHKLVHHDNSKYDAYRLTPLGYDYLAIKAFVNRGAIDGVDWGILFAAATLQLLPILAFVLMVQKYLIAGLTAGTVKG